MSVGAVINTVKAPVWPDVGVKSSQNVSKVAQKVALAGFMYIVTFFKRAPNKSPNIFMKICHREVKKYPNLVTLPKL